ncbi:MAG TPA: hypothetical protein VGY48_26170 [Vicinamibacterales bacterium]|jgi:hypothetical protein|nr:hypothetical protein [Vicinamibacterales bacterium]
MRNVATSLAAVLTLASVAACSHKEPDAPPVATPSLTLNHERAPLGSPLDITYKFAVANDAKFDEDYRVMVHVMDTDEQMIWTDDHNPPVPTRQWKPGQAVEYTRTVFVPVYPYVGEATIQVGLYSTGSQKRLPLNGENVGQRAYKVGRVQLQPQTENLPSVFKDGWHAAEVVEHNTAIQWQWTKKEATFAFKNPRKDCIFYFDVDNPTSVLNEPRHVQLTLNGQPLEEFTLQPGVQELKKIPLKADQLGPGDNAELHILVDKSYIPALIPAANNKDPRELGIRVFHAFVDPR